MDSSPDLSLKLRRGSSDSRETFYMDFAQGIDSDIEEVKSCVTSQEPQIAPTPSISSTNTDAEPFMTCLPVQLSQSINSNSETAFNPAIATDEALPSPQDYCTSDSISSPKSSEIIPPPPLELFELQMDDMVENDEESKSITENFEQDEDDDKSSSPPPALQPLPKNFSYVQGPALDSSVRSITSQKNSVSSPDKIPCAQMVFRGNTSNKYSDSSSPSNDGCFQDLPPSPKRNSETPSIEYLPEPNKSHSSPSGDSTSSISDENLLNDSSKRLYSEGESTNIQAPSEEVEQESAKCSLAFSEEKEQDICFVSENIQIDTTENVRSRNEKEIIEFIEELKNSGSQSGEKERTFVDCSDQILAGAEASTSRIEESQKDDSFSKFDSPVTSIRSSDSSMPSIKCNLSKPESPVASYKSPPECKQVIPYADENFSSMSTPTQTRSSGENFDTPLASAVNEAQHGLPSKMDSKNETSLPVEKNSTEKSTDILNIKPSNDDNKKFQGDLDHQQYYRYPHHFQHPHHQNHHNHGVPVAIPTAPFLNNSSFVSKERSVWNSSIAMNADIQKHFPNLESKSYEDTLQTFESARSKGSSQHRVTIAEPKENVLISSPSKVVECGGSPTGPSPSNSENRNFSFEELNKPDHLALMCHSGKIGKKPVVPALRRQRPSFTYPALPRVKAGDALATLLSALYGKMLVVMGIAFPMAEVISTYIPPSFYEVYYLYLYIGSMIFLLFMYATLLWGKPKIPTTTTSPTKITKCSRNHSDSLNETDTESSSTVLPSIITTSRRPSLLSPLGRQHHYGSFYLRMGAVAFGIGSMIYSGLEFGQYFELNPDTKCHNVLLALTPATRMAFIFVQMYFIFLNNEQIKVYRYKIVARFGLMHMIGTNLAVWLNVLIQETKHEILTFYNPENRTLRISHRIPGHSRGHTIAAQDFSHLRIARGLKGPYQIFECRRTNIIGTLVQDASPFLFPCTIEYSLICAAILYVMWRSISRPNTSQQQRPESIPTPIKRSPHHYSVDCARAHKGLFVGILILVLTIISLILFFVLISRPDFVSLAVTEVTICELLIYGTATIATLMGMIQVRHLQYDAYRSFSLDDILLVGAQTGSFLYNIFTVIAGHFTIRSDDMLVPLNALASIVQTACQTMFILDASRRQAVTPEHLRKKPGREIVTFMLVVNLAMWAISTLEKSRAESHPIQLNFYGLWAWTIITHVSMPLAIFYRFHSTVCLCEIWKRAYKLKPAYM